MAIKLCLQKQVLKNANDIEDLQENQENLATKSYVENAISGLYGDFYTREQSDERYPTETHMNYVVGELEQSIANTNTRITNLKSFESEDEDYKTTLEILPDDVYVKYIDKEEPDVEHTYGVASLGFQVDRLAQRHLYAHYINIYVKFKDAGVTKDDFTGRVIFTILNDSNTQLDEAAIKREVQRGSTICAGGHANYASNQFSYVVTGITKYDDTISTDLEVEALKTDAYTASGSSTIKIGEITSLFDRVVQVV